VRRVLVVAALLALLPAAIGRAAFPGANGKIAFDFIDQQGVQQIATVNPDGTGLTVLTHATDANNQPLGSSWAPDGKQLAFVSGGALSVPNIFLMNERGGGVRSVTTFVASDSVFVLGGSLSFYPDGKRLFFTLGAQGPNSIIPDGLFFDQFAVDSNGRNLTELGPDSSGPNPPFPSFTLPTIPGFRTFVQEIDWSPDRSKAVFVLFSCSGNCAEGYFVNDLAVVNADGTGFVQLTHEPESAFDLNIGATTPAWSPDGQKIVFREDDTTRNGLTVINADGSNPTLLTAGGQPLLGFEPSWQPLKSH
jgi:Tol biopolymer transport system component